MPRTEHQLEPLGNWIVTKLTVGTSEVQIILSPSRRTKSVSLIPDTDNTGTIGVGLTGLAMGTDAAPIYNDKDFDINLATGNFYAISDTAAQTLWVLALLDEAGQ